MTAGRPRATRRLVLGVGILVLFLIVGVSGWRSMRAQQRIIRQMEIELQLKQHLASLQRTRQEMTLALDLAVTTGEPRWSDRYRVGESEFNAALDIIMEQAPDSIISLLAEIDTRALGVRTTERRVLELILQGHAPAAVEILVQSGRAAAEERLLENVESLRVVVDQRLMTLAGNSRRDATRGAVAIVAAPLLLIIGWLVAYRSAFAPPGRHDRDAPESSGERFSTLEEAVAEIETLRQQLREASHQADMAEVATGVLHDVANLVNTVSVSASIVSGKVRESRAAGLSRVSGLLKKHTSDLPTFFAEDEKGKRLPDYFASLAERLATERREILDEFALMLDRLQHIRETIGRQQLYSGVSNTREPVAITALIDDALDMEQAALERDGVKIVKEYEVETKLVLDQLKALRIFVNLITNAREAVVSHDREDRRLTVRIREIKGGQIRIEMIDNGIGIAPENLSHIFDYGFTTKMNGHGFGLHSSAVVAEALGGSLRCHSDGEGTGTTFVLDLPLESMETAS